MTIRLNVTAKRSPGYKDPSAPQFCVTPRRTFSAFSFLNDVSCWREAFGLCRIILNPLPWITAASGSYCWVHVALNWCVLGFVWMLAGWLVESDVEGNREERRSPRSWYILRQHRDFRVDGLKPQDTRELSSFEPRIMLEIYWYINLLSEITILGSSCKLLRLLFFFFFGRDSEVWLCILYLALTAQNVYREYSLARLSLTLDVV